MGNRIYRYTIYFYFLCFAFLLGFIIASWKEVFHFNDAALYLFKIDYYKTFFTPHRRYIAVLVEYLPLLASYLRLDIKIYLISYIVNPLVSVVLLYILYAKITGRWQDGWVFILSLIAGLKYSFFYSIPEHFGYSFGIFSVLLYRHFAENKMIKPAMLFSLVVGIILGGSHFFVLGILLLGFILIYMIYPNTNTVKFILLQVFIVLGILVGIKLILPIEGYEVGKLNLLKENLDYIKQLDRAAFRFIFDRDQRYAPHNIALYSLTLFGIFYTRKLYFLLLIPLVFFLTYYVNCLYHYNWMGTEYMELYGRIIMLSLLLCLYFIYVSKPFPNFVWVLFTTFYIYVFCKDVLSVKNIYTERYQAIEQITQQSKSTKNYLKNGLGVRGEKIWFTWVLPYESLWISRLNGKSKTVYAYEKGTYSIEEMNDSTLYSYFETFPIVPMNKTYFEDLGYSSYQIID